MGSAAAAVFVVTSTMTAIWLSLWTPYPADLFSATIDIDSLK